ncbi:hypothetical protein J2T08_000546 [Neorhizobium galegae]|uniref:hypothetical protein n=1 Tax=Neorhizobium galegae TaxID=399 RepID=UPI00277FD9A3|nr:hypothetical protein [Neorhizobium galegae]MDQ0132645.1 hypothetical protein [Neorhizobium galegae]
MLKSGGMLVPKSIAAADFIKEYTIALGGVPVHGLMTVVAKLKRGEYPDVPAEFMPLPAQLAAMARAECRVILDDVARLREKKNALSEAVKPAEISPEERRRQIESVRLMRTSFRLAHLESKASVFSPVHEPMDADKAEYWKKVAALPDAKSIDADQSAFRRKVASDLAAAEPKPAMAAPPSDDDFIPW